MVVDQQNIVLPGIIMPTDIIHATEEDGKTVKEDVPAEDQDMEIEIDISMDTETDAVRLDIILDETVAYGIEVDHIEGVGEKEEVDVDGDRLFLSSESKF